MKGMNPLLLRQDFGHDGQCPRLDLTIVRPVHDEDRFPRSAEVCPFGSAWQGERVKHHLGRGIHLHPRPVPPLRDAEPVLLPKVIEVKYIGREPHSNAMENRILDVTSVTHAATTGRPKVFEHPRVSV
jgi:hypothetical protein